MRGRARATRCFAPWSPPRSSSGEPPSPPAAAPPRPVGPAQGACSTPPCGAPGSCARCSVPDGPPLVALVAPAGYGKTTLLREWAERDRRPFAWVTLDERDNDAGRLLARVARAVDDAVGDDGEAPFVLVLDDVHVLRGAAAVRALRAIANDLPHAGDARARRPVGAAAAARAPARPRTLVLELGPRELALTRAETAALLRGAGHELDRDGDRVRCSSAPRAGPSGLSLAGRFLDERGAAGGVRRFGGADRLVAGYVRDEVLAGLPPEAAEAAPPHVACWTRSPGRCATRCWSAPARPRSSPDLAARRRCSCRSTARTRASATTG